MCGIAGFLYPDGSMPEADAVRQVQAMGDALAHRGPDGGDVWTDGAAGIALAHRRLAVVDLSPAGRQPMASADGRWVVSYNGEVYNAAEIRAELEAAGHLPSWRGHSDTEVMVEGFARWGVEETVKRLIGMFAIAVWDRQDRRLWLVRDRMGIKPLYWGMPGDRLMFGSELKALRACPGWRPEIDRDTVAPYLRFGYIPGPLSIWEGIHKLPPGCLVTVRAGEEPKERAYWSMADVARTGLAARADDLSDADATDQLESLLRDAVGRRMVADVPLGAFLSGGIDSSTVVALMQAQSDRPVRTFSIGFREGGYDEAKHAAAVAKHLGTDHTELYVEPQQALDIIPRLPEWWDEPFADSSQIPTFLVSQMTRRHVTVALSGDGGDELFGGYSRYLLAHSLWRRLEKVPAPLRSLAARGIKSMSPQAWQQVFNLLPANRRPFAAGHRIHKMAEVMNAADHDDLYRRLVTQYDDPMSAVPGGREAPGALDDPAIRALVQNPVERMQYLDTVTYLPDDILTKVDRASMAVALEARVPLLDHRVAEFAWALPERFKIRDGQGKWLLRQVLDRHVPRQLIDRPKMGFGVPIDAWLRGPLRDWAEDLLDEKRLAEDGIFNPAPIRRKWQEHLSGGRSWPYALWTVLMFQAWRSASGSPSGPR
jgi:asparagine synthase (glutamine-hydrolysing)